MHYVAVSVCLNFRSNSLTQFQQFSLLIFSNDRAIGWADWLSLHQSDCVSCRVTCQWTKSIFYRLLIIYSATMTDYCLVSFVGQLSINLSIVLTSGPHNASLITFKWRTGRRRSLVQLSGLSWWKLTLVQRPRRLLLTFDPPCLSAVCSCHRLSRLPV